MMELMPVAWLHARMIQASTNGMTYLRRNNDSAPLPSDEDFAFSAAMVSSISRSSASACSGLRERSRDARAASLLPRRNSHRGDSATKKLPTTNNRPGGNETQKMLRQAVSLKARSWAVSPSLATSSTRQLK